ncbi:helix-turn-helix domain-containing protein [Actinorhabdospora filicis]|uniref:helix-turn-helix domain-containing protein n=1 Tax=Actinorhabdospora filicis TaxID=1785913 RepID=UPI003D7F49DC
MPACGRVTTARSSTWPSPNGRRAEGVHRRFTAVRHLADLGWTITVISTELGLDRKTVRKYAASADVNELLESTPARRTAASPPTCRSAIKGRAAAPADSCTRCAAAKRQNPSRHRRRSES